MKQFPVGLARARAVSLVAFTFCFALCPARSDDRVVPSTALPDAPSQVAQAQAPTGTASISGVVLDSRSEPVPGAKVTISEASGAGQRTAESDDKGEFHFREMAPITVRVTVTATGLETFVSDEIRLSAGEQYVLPRIDLPVAPLNSSVTVTVTEDQLATEQVHEQEKQRVLGVIPNFYTSYLWDAAPLHTKQKAQLAFRSVIDPVTFVIVGARAGVQQVRNTDPGYGGGPAGYGRRFGADLGDSVTGRLLGQAILPAVFHQDPRYFYLGTGSTGKRLWYALTRAVVTRGDNGKDQPNYSHVLGNLGAAALRNLYLEPEDRKGLRVLTNGVALTGYNAVSNVIREFISRPLSTHVPAYKNGKPADVN